MERRRVVITGIGVVSALGCSLTDYWNGLISGRSGIQKITHFDASELPCQIAGQVPDFDPLQYMDRKTARRMPRSTQLAVAVARQAIEDAGVSLPLPEPEKTVPVNTIFCKT